VKGIAVVDNGSTDRTVEVAQRGARDEANARGDLRAARGYGAACLAGIRAAVPFDPEVLVILDADESTDVSDLGAIVDPILRGEADMVRGIARSAPSGRADAVQRFGNVLGDALSSSGSPVTATATWDRSAPSGWKRSSSSRWRSRRGAGTSRCR
jgi:glycosyltransferase involved in cell wall biosynthesis